MGSENNLKQASLQDRMTKLTQTRFNYWAEFVIDIPLGGLLIVAGVRNHELGPVVIVLTVLLGLLLYSFIEYFFHRWLFHGPVEIMAEGHRAHHDDPMGYDALPFFLPAIIMLVLTGVFVLFMPLKVALLLMGTITLSYTTYGLSHFIIHHHRFRKVFARDWAANHHIHHHHEDKNFGVTTPLWDIVLGTLYKRKR
ncbi:sterol desaturase family protein [Pontiellaceae bacterium B12219]|nr:sterol desaturase family protein [Pontiellaceae bacterium B12219]